MHVTMFAGQKIRGIETPGFGWNISRKKAQKAQSQAAAVSHAKGSEKRGRRLRGFLTGYRDGEGGDLCIAAKASVSLHFELFTGLFVDFLR
jgi:hypothetical protein